MSAIDEIAAERQRQIAAEGWTPDHDDKHAGGELSRAATAYAWQASLHISGDIYGKAKAPGYWPWDMKWWKPVGPRRDLIKAAALIVAEIERIDRATVLTPS